MCKWLCENKEAAYLWHLCLRPWLIEEGFRPNDADCCVFTRSTATPAAAAGGDGSFAVGIHIDDLLTTGYVMAAIADFKHLSGNGLLQVKDFGQMYNLLGMVIKQDLVDGTVHLSQQQYIDELLEHV